MDLKTIKDIVNGNFDDHVTERFILNELSKDEDVIPKMLDILKMERETKKEVLTDINLELSRAHLYIEMAEIKKESKQFTKSFVLDEIAAFYVKYKGHVTHCFNRFK